MNEDLVVREKSKIKMKNKFWLHIKRVSFSNFKDAREIKNESAALKALTPSCWIHTRKTAIIKTIPGEDEMNYECKYMQLLCLSHHQSIQ